MAAILAITAARPQEPSHEVIPILRNDFLAPSETGEYSFDVETGDGIIRSESGAGSGPDGAVESQGSYSFTHPNGEVTTVNFVANAAGGFQAESDSLPVAPAFPFELPDFVLEQIARSAEEDKAAANAV